MEKQLDFVLRLSLEEMALRRVVVNLWSEADVLASIESLRFKFLPNDEDGSESQMTVDDKVIKSEQWWETIRMVKDKVFQRALPESLEYQMILMVRPIGFEVPRWRLLFHEAHLSDSREESLVHLQQLYWTSAGTVDYAKTAERLIRLQSIDVVKRYQLACLYCLEKDISVLWKELPEEYRTGTNGGLGGSTLKTAPLEDYWTQVLKGEEPNVNFDYPSGCQFSLHGRALEYSTCNGNKAAAEYFLQKLTAEERDSSLVEAACSVLIEAAGSCGRSQAKLTDLFCYLLSQMTPEKKVETMENIPNCCIFCCLLNWPWQDLFLDAVGIINSLPESIYYFVAGSIGKTIREGGVCFPKLLQDFFLRCPRDFRNHFVFILFDSLFVGDSCIPDVETIKEIFRNVDLRAGELASDLSFSKMLFQFVILDQWDIVELCLREALLSKEDGERLRETFEIVCSYFEDILCETGGAQQFHELLDKTEASAISKGSELDPTNV